VVAAFRLLAEYQHAGKLLVKTTARLLASQSSSPGVATADTLVFPDLRDR
jgi:hypothetical protein